MTQNVLNNLCQEEIKYVLGYMLIIHLKKRLKMSQNMLIIYVKKLKMSRNMPVIYFKKT